MLLTFEPEDGPERSCPDPEDEQWAEIWWMQLLRTFSTMDTEAGLVTATSASLPKVNKHPVTIDLDTQASQTDEPLELPASDAIAPPAEAVLDERDLHDLQLQEEDRMKEEEHLLEMVKQFEQEENARASSERALAEQCL